MWLLLPLAFAETPLPSFEDELSREVEARVEALFAAGKPEEALAASRRFRESITDTPHLAYLDGLVLNRAGRLDEAEAAYRRSIAQSALLPEAWYDLGELLLVRGAFVEAGEAFAHATRLYPVGREAWRSPLRQAEVAGYLRQPEAMEAHLKVALARGFSFRDIEGVAHWQQFYADPLLRDALRKLLTVYSTPDTLESLVPLHRRLGGELNK